MEGENLTESQARSVRKLTLYGMLPIQALMSQLEAGFLAAPLDRESLQSEWVRSNEAFRSLPPSRSYLSPEDLKATQRIERAKLETLLARARIYPPYNTHATEVQSVRISKLVTPQIALNVSRADARATVRSDMSEQELFDLAFQPAGEAQEIRKQTLGMAPNGGSLMFTSYDEDIRVHHPPSLRRLPLNEEDREAPSFDSVCLPVGGGLPLAAAYKVQMAPGLSRLILANGIHRVYKLAAAGNEWCVLLTTEIAPLELPDPFIDLPKEILLDPAANPPLIGDFSDESLAINLSYHPVLKTVRLNWSFEQYVTVLS